ncbi:phage holin family protein [Xanthomonas campestris]|uniref:phage holin family protein n=1 Tax=Xanthomonas campestris TaxID=339 RepID=UPI000E1F610B|nr:phage holin family protein [Xanthomonas campestris]
MSDQASTAGGPDAHDARPETPGLDESVRQVGAAGRATLGSARDTSRALRRLVSADLQLARSAFGRGLAWACVAVVFGASSWLLLAGAIIALLQRAGLSWFQAMFFTALASLLVTGLAAWRGFFYFDHTGMNATRRQLVRLGIFDDGNDDDTGPASPAAPSSTTGGRP